MIRERASGGSPLANRARQHHLSLQSDSRVRARMMTNLLKARGVAVMVAALGLALGLLAGTAGLADAAGSPTPLNKFTDWSASTYDDGGKTLCYATSDPKKQAGKFGTRGKPYIAITHAPQANVRDQVSYVA